MLGRRSIRFRLTVWYAAILTVGLGISGCLTWLSLRERLLGEIDRELEGRAGRFEKFFRSESAEVSGAQLNDELEEFCQALPPASYLRLRRAGGVLFEHAAAFPVAKGSARIFRRQFAANGNEFDIEIGTSVADVTHTLEILRLLLWSLLPVVIAIACVGGAWLSARALKPVDAITAAAHTISIENLSGRLPVPSTGDEIARLTEVLNTMLARLESAVTALSHFVTDASHEFRTPLAVIRTSAELALRRTREPEAYRDSLRGIAAEADRMTTLVEDLLLLARSETARAEMPLEPLDVREVVAELTAQIQSLAEVRSIRLKTSFGDRSAVISGNRPALRRLFLVLLDNSVKYSHQGGEVHINVEREESGISVTVKDFGIGIRECDLPRIFERFYQANRDQSNGGHGLGLALAQSIARAHGTRIEVRSVEGAGSEFRVGFVARESATGVSGQPPSFSQSSASSASILASSVEHTE